MATRVNAFFDWQSSAATAVAYDAGAMVDGAQSAVNTVTVHSGHSIVANDLFLYALTASNILTVRVFTCSSKTDTSVTFSGNAFSFPDGALLIPLGTDTGGILQTDGSYTLPNWDGSTAAMFSDAAGDDAISSATVQPDGFAGFYSDTVPCWVLGLNKGSKPVQMLLDVGSAAASGSGSMTRGAAFPGSPTLGDQHLLTGVGPGDILYTYMTTSSGNGWVEGIGAP